MRKFGFTGILLLSTTVIAGTAQAQTANPGRVKPSSLKSEPILSPNQTQLEDIVVTARRVAERSQDTPVSVTAFNNQAIERRNITDLSDVARLTPGLTFESYSTGAFANPTIRGAAQSRIDFADQNVSIFFDGIYLPRQYAVDIGTSDLERVEVLKGPQSALYGRSAFAGAINYVPIQPSDELSGRLTGTLGDYGRRDIYGSISIPSSDGRFSVRAGGGYSHFDGSIFNPNPNRDRDYKNGSTGRVGGYEKKNAFAELRVKPIDRLQLNLAYYRFESSNELTSQYRLQQSAGELNCGNRDASGLFRLYCGEPPYREGTVDPRSNGLTVATDLIRAAANFDITNKLSLSYIHGFVGSNVDSLYNADQDPLIGTAFVFPRVNLFYKLPSGVSHMRSDEARVRYKSNSLNIVIGGYRQRQRDTDSFVFIGYPVSSAPLDTLKPLFSFASSDRALSTTDLEAVFGQITYRGFGDQIGIDLQGRYTWEDKSLQPSPFSAIPASAALLFARQFKYFTPRATIDFKPSSDHMIYASVAKGVKSGGFNTTVFNQSQRSYDPDKNWTYEIGTKNEFFNRRLRLNAAIFYMDWINIQTNIAVVGVPPGRVAPSVVGNGKGATIPGFEIETEFIVGGGLSIDGSVSYQKARFKNGYISQRTVDLGLCDGSSTCPSNGNAGNNQLPRSSDFQAQGGFSYSRSISDTLRLFSRVDATYQTKQFIDDLNLAYVPSRTILNASAGIAFDNDHYELQVWSKNLLDQKYLSAVNFVPIGADIAYVPNAGQRRTIGLTLRAKY